MLVAQGERALASITLGFVCENEKNGPTTLLLKRKKQHGPFFTIRKLISIF